MRICFAIGNLSYSGAEKILYNLILELLKRNHNISVILLSCSKRVNSLPKDVKQFPLYNKIDEEIKNKIIRVKKRQSKIKRVIGNNNFDVVVSFGVKFNIDIAEACKHMKTKLILCERNDPIFDPKSKILRLRRFLSYRHANGFVFQTDIIKNFFPYKIQKRSVVIPNFIDVQNSNMYINLKHNKSFITCARLDDNQKNQSLLIEAFNDFLNYHPDYLLEFIGDGPDKNKYIEMAKKLGISEKIIFHGKIKNPTSILPNSLCFILTSKFEGMPNALIEAMSVGMPCISTDCSGGGAKFLINDKKNGFLVENYSKEELINIMNEVANNKYDLLKISKNAFEINNLLEMNNIVDKWEKFIVDIAK